MWWRDGGPERRLGADERGEGGSKSENGGG
jgi:hypothetical protein